MYRLTPTERQECLQRERKARHVERLKQVRSQARQAATRTRQRCQAEANHQRTLLKQQVVAEWAEDKENRLCHMEDEYVACLREVGSAHRAAKETPSQRRLETQKAIVGSQQGRAADRRYQTALSQLQATDSERMLQREHEQLRREQTVSEEKLRADRAARRGRQLMEERLRKQQEEIDRRVAAESAKASSRPQVEFQTAFRPPISFRQSADDPRAGPTTIASGETQVKYVSSPSKKKGLRVILKPKRSPLKSSLVRHTIADGGVVAPPLSNMDVPHSALAGITSPVRALRVVNAVGRARSAAPVTLTSERRPAPDSYRVTREQEPYDSRATADHHRRSTQLQTELAERRREEHAQMARQRGQTAMDEMGVRAEFERLLEELARLEAEDRREKQARALSPDSHRMARATALLAGDERAARAAHEARQWHLDQLYEDAIVLAGGAEASDDSYIYVTPTLELADEFDRRRRHGSTDDQVQQSPVKSPKQRSPRYVSQGSAMEVTSDMDQPDLARNLPPGEEEGTADPSFVDGQRLLTRLRSINQRRMQVARGTLSARSPEPGLQRMTADRPSSPIRDYSLRYEASPPRQSPMKRPLPAAFRHPPLVTPGGRARLEDISGSWSSRAASRSMSISLSSSVTNDVSTLRSSEVSSLPDTAVSSIRTAISSPNDHEFSSPRGFVISPRPTSPSRYTSRRASPLRDPLAASSAASAERSHRTDFSFDSAITQHKRLPGELRTPDLASPRMSAAPTAAYDTTSYWLPTDRPPRVISPAESSGVTQYQRAPGDRDTTPEMASPTSYRRLPVIGNTTVDSAATEYRRLPSPGTSPQPNASGGSSLVSTLRDTDVSSLVTTPAGSRGTPEDSTGVSSMRDSELSSDRSGLRAAAMSPTRGVRKLTLNTSNQPSNDSSQQNSILTQPWSDSSNPTDASPPMSVSPDKSAPTSSGICSYPATATDSYNQRLQEVLTSLAHMQERRDRVMLRIPDIVHAVRQLSPQAGTDVVRPADAAPSGQASSAAATMSILRSPQRPASDGGFTFAPVARELCTILEGDSVTASTGAGSRSRSTQAQSVVLRDLLTSRDSCADDTLDLVSSSSEFFSPLYGSAAAQPDARIAASLVPCEEQPDASGRTSGEFSARRLLSSLAERQRVASLACQRSTTFQLLSPHTATDTPDASVLQPTSGSPSPVPRGRGASTSTTEATPTPVCQQQQSPDVNRIIGRLGMRSRTSVAAAMDRSSSSSSSGGERCLLPSALPPPPRPLTRRPAAVDRRGYPSRVAAGGTVSSPAGSAHSSLAVDSSLDTDMFEAGLASGGGVQSTPMKHRPPLPTQTSARLPSEAGVSGLRRPTSLRPERMPSPSSSDEHA